MCSSKNSSKIMPSENICNWKTLKIKVARKELKTTQKYSRKEICLLANTKRVASVRADTYCNLFSLSAYHFDSVLKHYPVMRRTMESVAVTRLSKIGRDPTDFLRSSHTKEKENEVSNFRYFWDDVLNIFNCLV